MRNLFVLTFFLSLFFNLSSQDNDLYPLMKDRNEFYFSFKYDLHQLADVANLVSIDKVDGDNVVAYANSEEYHNFLTLGIETTLLTPPSMLENHKMYDGKTRDGYEWDEYPTYEAYEAMMAEYAELYPEECSLIELGTLESGRKLLVLRLNNDVSAAKPKVLLTSTIHGDETTGYVLMLRLIDELLTKKGNPEIDNVKNNIDLFVCPNANPDGTYRVGNHTVTGATRSNALGVDMNRNYPGDNQTELHVDDAWWRMLSRQYADLVHEKNPAYMTDRDNGVTNGAAWYVVNGSRQDYMNYYRQCREVTVECSSTKCPPASYLPIYWEYNRNAIYTFLGQALFGIRGVVRDAKTQQPLKALVRILNHDQEYSIVESQFPNGDFYRPIKAGTYTIEINANGYLPKRETVVVVDNEKTTLDVQLSRPDDFLEEYEDFELVLNTSGDVLFIKNKTAGKIHWELINIQGQIVKKSYEVGVDIEVSLCGLNSGIYFLNVVAGDKQAGRKIVVR